MGGGRSTDEGRDGGCGLVGVGRCLTFFDGPRVVSVPVDSLVAAWCGVNQPSRLGVAGSWFSKLGGYGVGGGGGNATRAVFTSVHSSSIGTCFFLSVTLTSGVGQFGQMVASLD